MKIKQESPIAEAPPSSEQRQPRRALGLLSGGLDSILASRLLLEQGIEVECVNFYTGFCIQTHTGSMRNAKPGAAPARHDALHAAEMLGVKLHIVDIAEDYVRIVTDPKHGYGSNLNPCLDCKIFIFTILPLDFFCPSNPNDLFWLGVNMCFL